MPLHHHPKTLHLRDQRTRLIALPGVAPLPSRNGCDGSGAIVAGGLRVLPLGGFGTLREVIRQQSILEQLTTGTPFDQPMALEDNDVLAIVLNNHQDAQRMVFYYSYQQGTWEITTTDCFELESYYEELEQGKAVYLSEGFLPLGGFSPLGGF